MATTLNPSDIILQATTPRLITASLASNLLFSGNVTGSVNGVSATDITNSITNFSTSNDQNGSAISAPSASTPTHTTNADGSVNLTLSWTWSGTEADIDGFLVFVIGRTVSGGYTIGSDAANETAYVLPASKRAQILYGVAADRWYTYGVRAYRRVSTNINSSGIIASSISQTGTGYRPSSSVAITVATLNGSGITAYQNSNVTLSVNAAAGSISLGGAGSGSISGVVNPSRPITSGNVSTYVGTNAISDNYIGSLSANKLTAGIIDANVITVTNLDASRITTGTLSANFIGAGTISSVTINSGTVNSGVIKSDNYAGYAWPAAGDSTGGFFLSKTGLLLGNGSNTSTGYLQYEAASGYFAVGRAGGQFIQFNGGVFTVNGDIIATGNIKAENVTVIRGQSGVGISNGAGAWVIPSIGVTHAFDARICIICTWSPSGKYFTSDPSTIPVGCKVYYSPGNYEIINQQSTTQLWGYSTGTPPISYFERSPFTFTTYLPPQGVTSSSFQAYADGPGCLISLIIIVSNR